VNTEAIINEGGRQYSVQRGSVIEIDRLGLRPGETVIFTDVRLLATPKGTLVGTPQVSGARVLGTVEGRVKGPKLVVYKYRRRKDSESRVGHRQHATRVRITSVSGESEQD
jgi:large subunit ribosomal protein L21